MKITYIETTTANAEIILIINKNFEDVNANDKKSLDFLNFKGEDETLAWVENRLYIGCEDFELDAIRTACANGINAVKTKNITSVKIAPYINNGDYSFIGAMVDGFILGGYSFDKYKSKKEESKLEEIFITSSSFDKNAIEEKITQATIIANATNMTRDIVNSIPHEITPVALAQIAKNIATENGYEIRVEGEKYLQESGMNSMLAVGRASIHESQLIHLTYKPKSPKAKVVLIGKGLTYDSGGLSLKPGDYMVTMKSDKSGGSAVLGIMSAIKSLGLEVEVHGIIGAVENMIGGNAFKPDDVLTARNGTTIEVRNTDAEGRLVLADCLAYAQDTIKDIDYIFDFATLTGACVVALGEYTSGIMGHNNKLKHMMFQAANDSGELVGALPFNKHLKKLLKSNVADISNISSSRYGGAITAGLFLDKFINEENKDKWLHIDIAGPAYVEKAWGYNPYGASGAGVRLGLSFLNQIHSK